MEEINYYTFCIGYDFLNDYFKKSEMPECDVVYGECRKLAIEFIKSTNYLDTTKSNYENLQDWIEENRIWIENQYIRKNNNKTLKNERGAR